MRKEEGLGTSPQDVNLDPPLNRHMLTFVYASQQVRDFFRATRLSRNIQKLTANNYKCRTSSICCLVQEPGLFNGDGHSQ